MNLRHFINNKKLLHLFFILAIISFPLIAGDCNKILIDDVNIPGEFVGNWKLIVQTGALQDICPQENVNFQSTGIAQLTCPGEGTISRDFEIDNAVLAYTQSSITYDYEFDNENQNLYLYGRNVSRNLYYERITANIDTASEITKSAFINSSEVVK